MQKSLLNICPSATTKAKVQFSTCVLLNRKTILIFLFYGVDLKKPFLFFLFLQISPITGQEKLETDQKKAAQVTLCQ